jgi:plastocyanin
MRLLHGSFHRAGVTLALATVVLATGCSSSERSSGSAASGAAPAAETHDPGTVIGMAPKGVNGFPAIVVLEPATPDATPQAQVPVMDQVQQTFTPALLLVRTGQPVEFRNNDDVLHNVKVRNDATKEGTFNVAIPTGEKFIFAFSGDGFYDVGCDIHPAMSAQIVASSSPHAVTAEPEGHFAINGVAPGSYTAIAYAGAQKIEKSIIVPLVGSLDLTK